MSYATIEGFEKLTAQEVFDISAKHLLKQNKRALRDNASGQCAYRSSDGLQCAAGPFLTDNLAKTCEGQGWFTLKEYGLVPGIHVGLVSELQNIHDGQGPSAWREQLALLAEKYGLNTEALS